MGYKYTGSLNAIGSIVRTEGASLLPLPRSVAEPVLAQDFEACIKAFGLTSSKSAPRLAPASRRLSLAFESLELS